MYFLLVVLFVLVLLLIYWYGTKNYNYWKEQNIPSLPNPLPYAGHFLSIITLRDTLPTFGYRVYKNAKTSMVGFYSMLTPSLVVCETELVKSVLQTNFKNFRINYFSSREKVDPMLMYHPLFAVDYEIWKDKRSHVTQIITSAKTKNSFYITQNICSKMENFLNRNIEKNGGSIDLELKSFFLRYTGETIANNAFGIEGQCFDDNPDPSSFHAIVGPLFIPNPSFGWRLMTYQFLPSLANYLGVRFMTKEMQDFCFKNLRSKIKERIQNNEPFNDVLQYCLESSIGKDLELVAGTMCNYFLDVFELTSTSLANITYLLSQHPEIQEKARKEVLSKLDGNPLTLESLKEMTYLEQVLNESFRHTVPAGFLFRVCTEEITLTGSDGLTCKVKPGHRVLIPVLGLQTDEKYWPNPEVFDPERFSPENRASNDNYAFLPFGEGPRKCPGEKLGSIFVKAGIAALLSKFSIEHSAMTKTPLELDTIAIATYYKGGLWAKFKKLNS